MLAVLAFARDAQRGRGERGRVAVAVAGGFCVDDGEDGVDAGFGFVGRVGVGRLGGFEGEADELAAAGDAGPGGGGGLVELLVGEGSKDGVRGFAYQ